MLSTAERPPTARAERIRWVPKQFGAWAILAVPLLLGVAASSPTAWQLVLAIAAGSAYLASVAALEWARSKRRAQLRPLAVFGAAVVVTGGPLVMVAPQLVWVAAFVVAAAGLTLAASLAGHPKSVVVSLVEVAQALALVPAAALLSDPALGNAVWLATLAAGLYLVGSVLMVRSMIRERGNRAFLATSLAYHVVAVGIAWLALPAPYAALAVGLLTRAVALPAIQLRWPAARLRPIHIGIVEIVASAVLVVLAFAVGF
jgi:hypothetical protein